MTRLLLILSRTRASISPQSFKLSHDPSPSNKITSIRKHYFKSNKGRKKIITTAEWAEESPDKGPDSVPN